MRASVILAGVAAISIGVAGCATKRYPIATPLSEAEIELMDCDDLRLELVRTEQVQHQITETAQTDWRSVAGFLGDYGIGNAMAKSEAETALSERMQSIRAAQARRGCL
jgi:hypothetical protein